MLSMLRRAVRDSRLDRRAAVGLLLASVATPGCWWTLTPPQGAGDVADADGATHADIIDTNDVTTIDTIDADARIDAVDNMDAADAGDAQSDVSDASDAPVDRVSSAVMPPRPIGPLSTSLVTNSTPRLEWSLPTGTDGAIVELCPNRACTTPTMSIPVPTDHVDLPASAVHRWWNWWRLRGTSSGFISATTSPVWQFYVPTHVTAPRAGRYGSVLDWNGDGAPDLAIASPGASSVSLWTNTGTSYGASSGSLTMPSAPSFAAFVSPAGDVDGDGLSDVAVVAQGSGTAMGTPRMSVVFVYHANGTTVAPTPDTITIAASNVRSIASAGDVNHDGYADIVVGSTDGPTLNHDGGEVTVIYGSASPLTSTSATLMSNPGLGYIIGVSGAGDVNGDGFDDLAVSADTYSATFGASQASIWTGGATAVTPDAATFTEPAGVHFNGPVAAGCDFDMDGWPDLAFTARPTSGSTFSVFRYSSGGSVHAAAFDSTTTLPTAALSPSCLGDVNGDGIDDVVFGTSSGSFGGGRIYVWSAHGTTPVGASFGSVAGNSSIGTVVRVIGDYDLDGLADVAVGAPATSAGTVLLPTGSMTSPYLAISPATLTLLGLDAGFGGALAFLAPRAPRVRL